MISRRSPLPRRRVKPRRPRSPRCSVRGCKRIARVVSPCECGNDPAYCSSAPRAAATNTGARWCVSHAKDEADRRWRAPARTAEACELAGVDGVACGGPIQAAHGFPRKYLGTRWLALNRWLICSGHHRYYTDRWPEWVAVMRSRLGDAVYDELDRLRQAFVGGPVDYAAVLAAVPDGR